MIFQSECVDESGFRHIYPEASKCHENDSFDVEIGERMALVRIQEMLRKKPYNASVVCVKTFFGPFEVGKVYKVVDGFVITKTGHKWNENEKPAYCLNDINEKAMIGHTGTRFAEFVEFKGEA